MLHIDDMQLRDLEPARLREDPHTARWQLVDSCAAELGAQLHLGQLRVRREADLEVVHVELVPVASHHTRSQQRERSVDITVGESCGFSFA
jgi:hypothetical protein